MALNFDPGALLAGFHQLPGGPKVCLRLARIRDQQGIKTMFDGQGVSCDEIDLARLVRADPRQQVVICATALLGASETVVGVGAIDLDGESEPWLLVVDDERAEGLDQMLIQALASRAETLRRRRAA